MLDFLGFIITSALMVFAVNAVIAFMDVSLSAKLILAALERHLLRQQSRRIFRLVDLRGGGKLPASLRPQRRHNSRIQRLQSARIQKLPYPWLAPDARPALKTSTGSRTRGGLREQM